MTYTFVYDKAHLPPWADVQSQELRFVVDAGLGTETILDGSAAKKLETKAAQAALVNPDRKELPVYKTKEQVEAEMKAAARGRQGAGSRAARARRDRQPSEGAVRHARRPPARLPRRRDAPQRPALRPRVRRRDG